MPTTALAPWRCAWASRMSNASSRVRSHKVVSIAICPPKIVSILAPMVPRSDRERTVTPRTTPRDSTIRYPSRVKVVEVMSGSTSASLLALNSSGLGVAEPTSDNACRWRIRMRGRRARSQDVDHLKVEPAKHISDQTAVTAPPERLGTHDPCSEPGGEVDEPLQPLGERLRCHVIGVAPEGCAPPRGVQGIGARRTPASQLREPHVNEPVLFECQAQRFSGEMGPSARTGVTTNVGHRLDVVRREELEKLLQRSGRMPDGPHGHC